MTFKSNSQQKLLDIISILPQLLNSLGENKRYIKIIQYLNDWNNKSDEDSPLPKIKDIQSATNLNYNQLRKRLTEIHSILFDGESLTYRFKKSRITMYATYFNESALIELNELSYFPRIGENITIPFFKGKIGTDWFFVEDIRHRLEGLTQFIDIHLKPGQFNSYWHFRKHKALELGEISFHEELYLEDYQIKKILKN